LGGWVVWYLLLFLFVVGLVGLVSLVWLVGWLVGWWLVASKQEKVLTTRSLLTNSWVNGPVPPGSLA
jgi:hypothetical protein